MLEAIYQDAVRVPDNVVSIEAKEPEHGRAETGAENHGNALDAVVSGWVNAAGERIKAAGNVQLPVVSSSVNNYTW